MNVYFVYKVLTNRIRALIIAAGYIIIGSGILRKPHPLQGVWLAKLPRPVRSRLVKLNKGDVCFLPRLWNTILSGNRIQALVNKQYYCFLEVRSDVAVAVL